MSGFPVARVTTAARETTGVLWQAGMPANFCEPLGPGHHLRTLHLQAASESICGLRGARRHRKLSWSSQNRRRAAGGCFVLHRRRPGGCGNWIQRLAWDSARDRAQRNRANEQMRLSSCLKHENCGVLPPLKSSCFRDSDIWGEEKEPESQFRLVLCELDCC